MKKYITLIAVSFALNTSTAWAQLLTNYAEVFDENIYDQGGISLASPRYREEALEKLYELKERSIVKAIAKRLQPELTQYQELLRRGVNQNRFTNAANIVGGFLRLAAAPLQVMEPIALHCRSLDGAIGGLEEIGRSLPVIILGEQNLTQVLPILQQRVIELRMDIDNYRRGIREENIKREEELYVMRKKDINRDLQQAIELQLINARRPAQPFLNPINFVKEALRLPLSHKNLRALESRADLLQRFNNDEFFNILSPELRANIEPIIRDIFLESGQNPPIGCKKSYLFWGNHGVLKTSAAEKIGKFLGLPVHEISIGDNDRLSEEMVCGRPLGFGNPNPGWLADVFLRGEDKKHKNAILIINDFDRLLIDGPGNQPQQMALSFLLNYLDKDRTTYHNRYFNSPIDISRLIIILTANRNIPSSNAFDALRDRLHTVVHFPDLTRDQVRPLLLDLCRKEMEDLHVIGEQTPEALVEEAFNESSYISLRSLPDLIINKVRRLPFDPQEDQIQQPQSLPLPLPLPLPAPSQSEPQSPFLHLHPLVRDWNGNNTDLTINAYYKIIHKSGKIVNIFDAHRKDADRLAVTSHPNDGHSQSHRLFRFIPQSDGYYLIENLESGKILNVYDAYKKYESQLTVTAERNDGACPSHRRFQLKPRGGGYFLIENKESGMVLNLRHAFKISKYAKRLEITATPNGVKWLDHNLINYEDHRLFRFES